MSTATTRILHMHIEKTGGTALRLALIEAMGPQATPFPFQQEPKMGDIVADEWDLVSGHFGYGKLAPLGGRMVTVLRDPVDRFVSVYYYLRHMHQKGTAQNRKTALAMAYPLDEFVKVRDDPALMEQYFNTMTWQLADSAILPSRQKLRADGMTDDALLALARRHLQDCAVVGIQERSLDFAHALGAVLNLPVNVKRLNVTLGRPPLAELSGETRRRIQDWVYLDTELYQSACALAARLPRQ